MDITYLGHSSFRLKFKSVALITDPFDPEMVGISYPKVSADIVTVSHEHQDHSKSDLVSEVKKVISGPGEYEIQGASIIGFSTFHDDTNGAERGENTIYLIEAEGLRFLHLGDLGHKLSENLLEEIGEIDVLMVPVGGTFTLDARGAVEVVQSVGAKVAIPMHYFVSGMNKEAFAGLSPVDDFLSQMGGKVEKTNKLTIKEGSLPEEEQMVVVLEKK